MRFVVLLVYLVGVLPPSTEVQWVDYIAKEELGIDEFGVEVRLFDDKRVDMVVNDYAIEVDWANKWSEGVGQALYYAHATDKKAGLILLVKNSERDRKYLYQALVVCRANEPKITLWAYDTDKRQFMSIGQKKGLLK
jgi:hypothetical protein